MLLKSLYIYPVIILTRVRILPLLPAPPLGVLQWTRPSDSQGYKVSLVFLETS